MAIFPSGKKLTEISLSFLGSSFISIVLGLIATLGYAPYRMWPVTMATLVGLFVLITKLKTKKAVFFTTLFYFLSLNLITLNWLSFVMEGFGEMSPFAVWPIITIFSCYLALPYAIGAVISKKLCKNRDGLFLCAFIPAIFSIADFIVGYIFGGFPWMYVGNTLIEASPFLGYIPILGVRGLNIILFFTVGALTLGVMRKFLYLPIVCLILAIGSFTSSVNYVNDGKKPLNVAMVQANIPQVLSYSQDYVDMIVGTLWSLSQDLFSKNDLIIWPESALPMRIGSNLQLLSDLNAIAFENKTNLVTGIISSDSNNKAYNSMFVLGKDEQIKDFTTYNKRKLVPFGEFVPFESILRPLGKIFNIPMSSFSNGLKDQSPILAGGLLFTPAICYEAIYPEVISRLNNKETSGILMISNDTWFGPTRAPYQHLDMARMRSMELQKPMLRATNSGFTALIDKRGNIVDSLKFETQSVLKVKFTPSYGLTPYARFGDFGVCILIAILLVSGIAFGLKKEDKLNDTLQKIVRP